MAAFPICYKTRYKDQNLPSQSAIRQIDMRFLMYDNNMSRSSSSIPGQMCRSCNSSNKINNSLTNSNTKEKSSPGCIVNSRCSLHKKEKIYTVWRSAESSSTEKQIRSLDSYFGKLQGNAKVHSFDSSNRMILVHHRDGQSRTKNGLESLDEYLSKLNNGITREIRVPLRVEHCGEENLEPEQPLRRHTERANFRRHNTFVDIRRIKSVNGSRYAVDSQQQDESSSLYLIGILASVNIAVFLFEIASPIRNANFELFSIPLLYGAKINDLIMVGEWWRLVTPMFLHAGILHMALSFWALVSFGPHVCRGYGSFTFFLIYILGGVSGNLTSFLHTPDPTVGGTGPVFAVIGAWLIYQIQNRDVIAHDASESLFRKAIIITALSFMLCYLGPIDEWTHFGAAFTGMAYGFLTSPTLQLDGTSSGRTGQEEGLKLVRKYGDSCKSLIIFTIFIIVLSSLLFFMEPPLNALASSLNASSIAANALEYMVTFGLM